jgi:peptidoglycan/xylan/chitin deacetylase (PgdA/CDA1 family)
LYTTRLLNILKELKIPAVFFLVGSKIENNPDLVRQIITDGHEIGLHSFDHCHAYLMFRRKSIQTVERGYQIIREATGQPPVWFRPPWGAANLFQVICAKRLQMRLVLWTANAADWKIQTGVPGIRQRLQKKVKGGTVIVLHDSGGESGAPENTLRALPEVISDLQQRGLRFTTLADLLGGDLHEWSNHITKDRTSY